MWLVDIAVLPMGLQSLSAPSVLTQSVLSPVDDCGHPPLYLSGSGRASQETALSGSFQQALLGIHNSVWVC